MKKTGGWGGGGFGEASRTMRGPLVPDNGSVMFKPMRGRPYSLRNCFVGFRTVLGLVWEVNLPVVTRHVFPEAPSIFLRQDDASNVFQAELKVAE